MMEWFTGTIDEALNEYQNKKGILIVYICDEGTTDQKTVNFNSLWDSFDKSLLDVPYVSIRLEKNSQGAAQFAEFFPTPIFPVCYVIGHNGQPLEVLTTVEELTMERFNNSMRKSVELFKNQLEQASGSSVKESKEVIAKEIKMDESSTKENEGIAFKETEEDESLTKDNQEKESEFDGVEDGSNTSSMTLEEKVMYAKRRLEEKRKMDSEKKVDEEKEKELRRRNEGKMLEQMREQNRDKELRELAEARRREKQEDRMALNKLREQIQRDKEERAKRSKPAEEQSSQQVEYQEKPPKKIPSVTTNYDECRIQCKFPDGSTLISTHSATATLQALLDVIDKDDRRPKPFYTLVQAYPRRQLTDTSKTFSELELCPSCALLVVAQPANGKRDLLPRNNNYFALLLNIFVAPIMVIFRIITSLFNSGENHRPKESQQQQVKTHTSDKPVNESSNDRNDQTSTSRREGNINRLMRSDEDSDAEGATYNGNSTQQL